MLAPFKERFRNSFHESNLSTFYKIKGEGTQFPDEPKLSRKKRSGKAAMNTA
jgi:hypothetical protein